jgi:hypothetical protein
MLIVSYLLCYVVIEGYGWWFDVIGFGVGVCARFREWDFIVGMLDWWFARYWFLLCVNFRFWVEQ